MENTGLDYTNIEIKSEETTEKFQPMREIIVPKLLELLLALSRLEEQTFERGEKLKAENAKNGISPNQSTPEELKLFEDYKEQYRLLVEPMCTEKLLMRRYAGSYGKPTQYGYVRTGCQVHFIMKSVKKATIEIHYPFAKGMGMKHQFVMLKEDGSWKIDSVKYAFSGKDNWLIQGI